MQTQNGKIGPKTDGLDGGAGWIRTPGAARVSMGAIRPEFGALFGPTKRIRAGENLFASDSALLRPSSFASSKSDARRRRT